jgi:hypothetical protein
LRLGLLRLRLRCSGCALVAELLDHLLASKLRSFVAKSSRDALSLSGSGAEHDRPRSVLGCLTVRELPLHRRQNALLI